MNPELREIAMAAGAPPDMMDEIWFNVFCLKFAHILLELAEKECST